MSPKVSVLIATYNRAHFIDQAIRSVLGQTLDDWELIIADDGSTDNTEGVCRGWEKNEKRIRYFRAPHFGRIAKISNFGLKQAKGEYVAILDDDDWWVNQKKLEKQTGFLDNNPDYVGCGGGFIIVDKDGNQKLKVLKPEKDADIKRSALLANPIANATAIFRRHAALKIDLYDETMLQFADWDFWLKLGLLGKLYNFQDYFAAYRMWEGGMSFSRQDENAASALKIVRRHKSNYPGFPKAFSLAFLYLSYTKLPDFVKRSLNPILSKVKKRIFSG